MISRKNFYFNSPFSLTPLQFWILIGFCIRIFMSATHSRWAHPDEWFQTVEFSNYIVNGIMSHTQEVPLHLRNLSWPTLLSIPLLIAKWISPEWVWLRIFLVQVFSGILDLGMFWGFAGTLKFTLQSLRSPRSLELEHLAYAFFILPWFFALDSIRPSQEHLSSVAFWICFRFFVQKQFTLAGIMIVAIGAFKYPAFLLSLGLLVGYEVQLCRNRIFKNDFKKIGVGLILGLVLFGLPDMIIYGRPWESFWMYLQYNVLSGLNVANFGSQSVGQYWMYFQGHWFGLFLPITLLAIPFLFYGFLKGITLFAPWALAGFFYLLGHLVISHKESRFMVPLETIALWSAFYGFICIQNTRPNWMVHFEKSKKIIRLIFMVVFLFNGLVLLRTFWGETWIASGTYFEVNRHLKHTPQVCAVVTVKKPLSVYLPSQMLNFGFFPVEKNQSSFLQTTERPLLWLTQSALCTPDQNFLLHLYKPDLAWEREGCQLLPSGLLSILPKNFWPQALQRNLVSGPWYQCPVNALNFFKKQEFRKMFAHTIPPIKNLPLFETTPLKILEILRVGGQGLGDGTFGAFP